MSCFSRWDKVGFGGRTGEEGGCEDGIGDKRGAGVVRWESCWAGFSLKVGKSGE